MSHRAGVISACVANCLLPFKYTVVQSSVSADPGTLLMLGHRCCNLFDVNNQVTGSRFPFSYFCYSITRSNCITADAIPHISALLEVSDLHCHAKYM